LGGEELAESERMERLITNEQRWFVL
jgi:hypothetical protein